MIVKWLVGSIWTVVAKVASLLLFIVTIFSAYGGRVDPHIWGFPSMLTLAFPFLAIATFLVTLMWVLAKKISMTVIGIATVFACWSAVLASLIPMGHSRDAKEEETTFTVASYNVMNGVDAKLKEVGINRQLQWVLDNDADIVCLQELGEISRKTVPNLAPEQEDAILQKYPYRIVDNAEMLVLLSKYPATLRNTESIEKKNARNFFQVYEVDLPAATLTIVNVHLTSYSLDQEERKVLTDMTSAKGMKESVSELKGPTIRGKLTQSFKERADNSENLRKILDHIEGPLIVTGDFNDVQTSWCYKTLKGDDLKDAYNETNFFWSHTFNDHLFLFHIDQMLYRPCDQLRALALKRGSTNASDHYPLSATFALKENP